MGTKRTLKFFGTTPASSMLRSKQNNKNLTEVPTARLDLSLQIAPSVTLSPKLFGLVATLGLEWSHNGISAFYYQPVSVF